METINKDLIKKLGWNSATEKWEIELNPDNHLIKIAILEMKLAIALNYINNLQ